MRLDNYWLFGVAVLVATLSVLEARRVRVQPVDYDDDAAYYADPQDDGSSRAVVLVGDDGYYQPQSRGGQDNYIPVTHRTGGATRGGGQSFKDSRTQPVKEKAPPVQTIRNYNKVNDDGSFTFGYEAADGSFKEETRGTDCVVRGKYGYVDPDGNKREFTYVSGNPCDPNAVKDEDESRERTAEDSAEPENVPANYPTRPIRPLRPQVATTPAPPPPPPPQRQQIYQQYVQEEEEEEEEPQQILRAQPQPVRHRLLPARPTYIPEERPVIQSRPRVVSSTTPSYEDTRPLTITPRPLTVTPTPSRPQPPATTYRPQLLQVAVTPRPALVYTTKQIAVQPQHHRGGQPGTAARDFVNEYQKFQLDNQISSTPTPTPTYRTAKPVTSNRGHVTQADVQANSNPVYSSELVFDPSSGQYKTALTQFLPQTEGEFTFNHKIQPYVHQPQPQLVNIRQLQQQSPLYRQASSTTPRATQAAYQAQQAEIQFQNSQQLFAQQQRARTNQHHQQQQQQQEERHAPRGPIRTEPQQFYYIQPQALQGVSGGQIDAFLRGHNIQY